MTKPYRWVVEYRAGWRWLGWWRTIEHPKGRPLVFRDKAPALAYLAYLANREPHYPKDKRVVFRPVGVAPHRIERGA